MAKKNADVQFLMKCVYWLAIGAGVAVVLYIAWQVFTTIYGGVS
jgi:uncharacterized membrane protein